MKVEAVSEQVEVPYGDSAQDTAVLLLEAAHLLDLPADVVQTTGGNGFSVPVEVADKAGFGNKKDDKDEAKPVAKKAAAKKTASKE